MSKGSDINVSSIEEDIKILQELMEDVELTFAGWVDILNEREKKALKNLIQDYTRQKQINEEHRKENGLLREEVKELDTKNDELLKDLYSANCIISDLTDSIPIQKIQDKIEELNNQEKELQNSITEEEREEYEDANISFLLCDIKIRREVLKELLQESEDK